MLIGIGSRPGSVMRIYRRSRTRLPGCRTRSGPNEGLWSFMFLGKSSMRENRSERFASGASADMVTATRCNPRISGHPN